MVAGAGFGTLQVVLNLADRRNKLRKLTVRLKKKSRK
jgi:hypothetical protein